LLKITILGIGKDKSRWVTDACDHYVKLLSRYAKIEFEYAASPKAPASLTPDQIRAEEASRLMPRLARGFTVALNDGGHRIDSRGFAALLERWESACGGQMTFVIGGPHGLHIDVTKKADYSLSLSPLTFSHQIVRVVLLEQLYRGFSILQGTSYHK